MKKDCEPGVKKDWEPGLTKDWEPGLKKGLGARFEKGLGARFEKGLGARFEKGRRAWFEKGLEAQFEKGMGAPAGRLENSKPQKHDAFRKNIDKTIQYYEVSCKKNTNFRASAQGGTLWSGTDFNAFRVSRFEKRTGGPV